MCKAMEERLERTRQEEHNKWVQKLKEDGSLPLEKIANMAGLSLEEVKKA